MRTSPSSEIPEGTSFSYPRHLPLGHFPTPLQRLERLSKELGVWLLLKRDDLCESAAGGNKVRKLEFTLQEMLDQGADTLVTCGAPQSNHVRICALFCARLGLRSVMLLAGERPATISGNLLLSSLAGAELRYVPDLPMDELDALMRKTAAELRARGARPYVLPFGGSNALGALGYTRMVEELAVQCPDADAIVTASASGGTLAGILLGIKLYGLSAKAVGMAVAFSPEKTRASALRIAKEAVRQYSLGIDVRDEDLLVLPAVGVGYSKNTPAELAGISGFVRDHGMVFDTTYSGKAFYHFLVQLRKRNVFGRKVVFVHTGGIFGLFAKQDALGSAGH